MIKKVVKQFGPLQPEENNAPDFSGGGVGSLNR